MKQIGFALVMIAGALALAQQSSAACCANGVSRAGGVGANAAVAVRKYQPDPGERRRRFHEVLVFQLAGGLGFAIPERRALR
ncbi:MAG: hypothetical protein JO081_04300 [Alphaproteobacteria bacterium]|nr:hypothetical protein [Alphaproteobacteria bacterium]